MLVKSLLREDDGGYGRKAQSPKPMVVIYSIH